MADMLMVIDHVFMYSVDEAAETAHMAIFMNMGQVCTAGSRLFVHEDIYDSFVNKVVEKAEKRRIGDPFDLTSESGPQVLLLRL
jgi:acyl-CoA reductase-like NAD-dependent aldehyde dehydrogenase